MTAAAGKGPQTRATPSGDRPLPAGPKGHPLLGHTAQWNADAMGFLTACAREYGDVVPIRLGPSRFLVLSHPDLVEEVLVTKHRSFSKGSSHRLTRSLLGDGLLSSEGEFWRRQRRLAQPAFHHRRIAAYAGTMVEYTCDALDEWRDGETRELHTEMRDKRPPPVQDVAGPPGASLEAQS